MKLEEIKDLETFEELRRTIEFLVTSMYSMSFEEFHDYRKAITKEASNLGYTFAELTTMACEIARDQDKKNA